VFEWITKVIGRLGYTGVALLTFLENLLPPIPSELVIPLAGYAAAEGDMRLSLMIVAATAGSLVGATIWYVVGRSVGEARLRALIGRHGKWLTLSQKDLDRAQIWFHDHGNTAVFLGRLLPGLRTFVSVPAGLARMPLPSYLAYSTLGTVLWTTALAYAGVVLQSNVGVVGDYINAITYAVFGVVGGMIVRRYIKCWRESARIAV
jgi:membrane protein DedA with SNARE-associated domain